MLQRGKLRPSGTVVRQELPSPAPRPLLRLLLPMGAGCWAGRQWSDMGDTRPALKELMVWWYDGQRIQADRAT